MSRIRQEEIDEALSNAIKVLQEKEITYKGKWRKMKLSRLAVLPMKHLEAIEGGCNPMVGAEFALDLINYGIFIYTRCKERF